MPRFARGANLPSTAMVRACTCWYSQTARAGGASVTGMPASRTRFPAAPIRRFRWCRLAHAVMSFVRCSHLERELQPGLAVGEARRAGRDTVGIELLHPLNRDRNWPRKLCAIHRCAEHLDQCTGLQADASESVFLRAPREKTRSVATTPRSRLRRAMRAPTMCLPIAP